MGSTPHPNHSLAPGTVAARAALFEQASPPLPAADARNRASAGSAATHPAPAPADGTDGTDGTDSELPLVNVAPVLLLRDAPSHDIELSSGSDSEPEAAAAAAPPAASAAAAQPSTPDRRPAAPSSSSAAAAGAGSSNNSLARSNSSGGSIVRTRCRITGHYIDTPAPARHSFVPLPGAATAAAAAAAPDSTPAAAAPPATPAAPAAGGTGACAAGALAGAGSPTASRLPPPAAVPPLQLEAAVASAAADGAPAAAAGEAAAGSSSAGSGLRQRRKTRQPAHRVRGSLLHRSPRPAADAALPAHAAVAAAAVNAVAAALARAPAAAATAAAAAASAAAAAAEKAAAVAMAAATVTAAPAQQAAAPEQPSAAAAAAAAAATSCSDSATQTPSHVATQTPALLMAAAGQSAAAGQAAAAAAVAPSPAAAAAPAAVPATVQDPAAAAAAATRPRHSSSSSSTTAAAGDGCSSSSSSGGRNQSGGGSVISSIWSSNWSRKWSSSNGGSGSSSGGGSSRASSSARRSSSSSASSSASSAAARAAVSWAALTSLLAIIGVLGTVGTALVTSRLAGRHAAPAFAQQAMAAAAAGGGSVSGSRVWGATQSLLGASFRAAQHPAGTLAAAGPGSSSSEAHMAAAAAVSHPGSSSISSSGSWNPFKSQLWGGSVITSLGRLNAARNRHTAAAGGGGGSGSSSDPDGRQQPPPVAPIVMFAVIDDAVTSPYKGADWGAVITHMSQRLAWSNPAFVLEVLTQQQLRQDESARVRLAEGLSSGSGSHQIFVGIAISDADVADLVTRVTSNVKTALFFDSAASLQQQSRVDGFAPATAGPLAQLLAERVGFSREAKAAGVMKTVDSLWGRHTSDDLLFIWLVLLNQYVTPVPAVAESTKGTDLPSLLCMVRHCGRQIVDCVTDKTCKAGLDCLEGCAFNDQVCQYRCIVSYETPKFGQFALCILQLHNCRNLDAQMPQLPDPAPMTSWRGAPLTHEAAEQLFIGWRELGPQLPAGAGPEQLRPYSWLVAAGKNPAYDFFPCQHQLYYAGKGKGQFWYEPVFKAITLEGKEVWRRRKYRVRRGFTPGTFHYTVLDNGVTSQEFWRIIDCDEEGLAWCLFFYSGAAATAGLSYSGAVLASVDGAWPAADTARVHAALGRAGIQPWELSSVDNSACVGAPL